MEYTLEQLKKEQYDFASYEFKLHMDAWLDRHPNPTEEGFMLATEVAKSKFQMVWDRYQKKINKMLKH